jgi:hypothetical protein
MPPNVCRMFSLINLCNLTRHNNTRLPFTFRKSAPPYVQRIRNMMFIYHKTRKKKEKKPTIGCNNTVCPFIVNVAIIKISTQTEITIRRHRNPISSFKSQGFRRNKNNILSLIPSLHPKMSWRILMKRGSRTSVNYLTERKWNLKNKLAASSVEELTYRLATTTSPSVTAKFKRLGS